MTTAALAAAARGARLVATPSNLDVPAWDRLVRRYVVSSQRHARLLVRAGVALGRVVVVEAGAEAEGIPDVFVSGPADVLDSGGVVAAAARGDRLVLVDPALVPDGARVVADTAIEQALHRARSPATEDDLRAIQRARAWWTHSHRAHHEQAALAAVYREVGRR